MNKNLTFTSKICFISPSQFSKIPLVAIGKKAALKAGKYVDYPWNAEQSVLTKEGFTDSIFTCNAGGITNGSEVFMFHLNPGNFKPENFMRFTKLVKEKIEGMKGDLRSIIVGGRTENLASLRVHRLLKDLFEELKLPHTVFWGQNSSSCSDIHYNGAIDTWNITSRDLYANKNTKNPNASPFSGIYKIRQVADGDEVFVDGVRICGENVDEIRYTDKLRMLIRSN